MTTKLEQAARQALITDEALMALELILRDGIEHGNWPLNKNCEDGLEAITALREALAEQAEQEPVGYFAYDEEHDIWEELTSPDAPGATPLYAAPVRTKDLTDDEIMKINVDTAGIVPTCDRQFHFARAVIAADREKNR